MLNKIDVSVELHGISNDLATVLQHHGITAVEMLIIVCALYA